MKDNSLGARTTPSQAARAIWYCLFLVICLGAENALLREIGDPQVQTQYPIATCAAAEAPRRADALWYFRSGQWRADMRTLAAAVRFILEPDSDPGNPDPAAALTNRPAGPSTRGNTR